MAVNTVQVDSLISLLDSYAVKGGQHLNVNVLDKDTLLDAQKHPEDYPQLTKFIRLAPEQQDDIISRTFHETI